MKLGTLINNQGVISKLYKVQLDGRRALQLRKILKSFAKELETFEELKNEKVTNIGKKTKDGNFAVEPGTPEYQEAVKYINELANTDIADPEPVFTDDSLEKLELSAWELDAIIAMGLYKEADDDSATNVDRSGEVVGSTESDTR